MLPVPVYFRGALLLTVALALAACSPHEHSPAGHGHAGAHQHQAPHGGHLYELGAHQFHLELFHDRAAGTLTAFILDAHAENVIRIAAPSIELLIDRNATTETLLLLAVANRLSNETVGDTSEFRAEADWLREATLISGRVKEISIRGTTFREIPFVLW